MNDRVLIAGGGVAALEALIALRELAGDRLDLTLLAPEPHFVYRPLAVAEPFCLGHAARHRLAAIAADFGAVLIRDSLAEVAPGQVTTRYGDALPFGSLLVAVGARRRSVYERAITFGADGAPEALAGLLSDLENGYAKRVAFVVPEGVSWSLPLYELALLTARDAWGAGIDGVELTFVTPETRPLELFGPQPSEMVAVLLAQRGIEFVGGARAEVLHNAVEADGRRIEVDRTVTLPELVGPRVTGLPVDAEGFVPVDRHGRVSGLDGVFAAGDMTDFPIKQGGLAAQQAVAAAEAIAARHGVDLEPEPFRPVLRGMLLTGGNNRWLRGPARDTAAASTASERALWWPPTKIATPYLGPYLMGRDEAERLSARPADAQPIERDLERLAPR
jgi:sulfide:quinone oxidoreductase